MSRAFRHPTLFLLAILIAAGCGASNPVRLSPGEVRLRDDLGREVPLRTHPQRIISLAPNITEMLFALGLGDRIAGVTSYCDYPPEAKSKEKAGDTINPSLERIVALHPDLVLVSTASQLEYFDARLRERGLPIFALDSHSLDSVIVALERLGELTGAQARAHQLTSSMREQISAVEARTRDLPPVDVFLVIQRHPLMAAGDESFLTDVIRRAGGRSITTDAVREYALYSIEAVIAKSPGVIIVPSAEIAPRRLDEFDWPELASTPAARNHRVYTVNNDLLLRPGPRLVAGLRDLASVLHPEASGARDSVRKDEAPIQPRQRF